MAGGVKICICTTYACSLFLYKWGREGTKCQEKVMMSYMDGPLSAEKVIAICTGYRACVAQGAGAWVNTQK